MDEVRDKTAAYQERKASVAARNAVRADFAARVDLNTVRSVVEVIPE